MANRSKRTRAGWKTIAPNAVATTGSTGDPSIYFVLNLSGFIELLNIVKFEDDFHFVLETGELAVDIETEVDLGLGTMVAAGKLRLNAEGAYGGTDEPSRRRTGGPAVRRSGPASSPRRPAARRC